MVIDSYPKRGSSMKLRQNLVFLLLVINCLILPVGCHGRPGPSEIGLAPGAAAQDAHQQGEKLRGLINSLSSTDDELRSQSEQELIRIGNQSAATRSVIIHELVSSVNSHEELDGSHLVLASTFLYWRSVTSVFVALAAVEGVEVLVRCIQCSNGYSGNMGEPPAAVALVRMGDIAVPKLSQALAEEPNSSKRSAIVICLARIDSPNSKDVLRQALKKEPNKDVRSYIKTALRG
jgi:HEAT repeats